MPVLDHQNPDDYRMSLGEHLEDLRRRLILALVGFVVVLGLSLFYGKLVIAKFCEPYVTTLIAKGQNPQFFLTDLSEGFMVYLRISLIVAAAISGPWALYQAWLFVAAGLYRHERKIAMRYAPLSVVLLVGGMAFVYFFVLPWTIDFFIDFGSDIPLETHSSVRKIAVTQPADIPPPIPQYAGDPDPWPDHTDWFNTLEGRRKTKVGGQVRVIPFGPQNLASPHLSLENYIDLVMGMLLTFALSFQLPLVVLALARIGILDLETLKGARKHVYFAMVVVAAVITPGDVITSTVALMVPLCLLYELGIWLAKAAQRRAKTDIG